MTTAGMTKPGKSGGGTGILIPEAHAVHMIESCARQIDEARTIPDVMRVISQAEAIDAVMKKLKASKEVKRAALALLVDVERQLGRLCEKLPHKFSCACSACRVMKFKGEKDPLEESKSKILEREGIAKERASVATRLAKVPEAVVQTAIDASAKKPTVRGVAQTLGLVRDDLGPDPVARVHAEQHRRERNLYFLAGEAIALLERSVVRKEIPHSGSVAEMRKRLGTLSVGA